MDYKLQEPPDKKNIVLKGVGVKPLLPPTEEDPEYENPFSFGDTSRYQKTKVINYSDGVCLGRWTIPTFPESYGDTFYEVTSGNINRLDLISAEIYGTVLFWWVLAVTNDIANPFEEVETGKLLRVPAITDIYSRLTRSL